MSSFKNVGRYLRAITEIESSSKDVDVKSPMWYLERLRTSGSGYLFHLLAETEDWSTERRYMGPDLLASLAVHKSSTSVPKRR
jgi:hypothetical protein